jgi:SPP1 gp7 family putative phage head morphogenesis protein
MVKVSDFADKLNAQLSSGQVTSARDALLLFWRAEGRLINAEEVKKLLQGNEEYIDSFEEEFSKFVNDKIARLWRSGAGSGVGAFQIALSRLGAETEYEDLSDSIQKWINDSAGKLISNVTENQREAIKVILEHYTVTEFKAPQAIAVILEPAIGLTAQQGRALVRYRASLEAQTGLWASTVDALTQRRADDLKRKRALTIARTETTNAFNEGQQIKINRMLEKEEIKGPVLKEWITSEDEKVCKICGPLDGIRVPLNGRFGSLNGPSAHPNCRCTLGFEVDIAALLQNLE